MLEKILRSIEKFIPKKIYHFFQPAYHYSLSLVGAILYGFPARNLKIIGVTGTKGKSTTVELLNAVLEKAGQKTALTSTIHFKIGEKIIPNKYKMSMPGRFFMQKFLHDAKKAGCSWVILELTSEGAKQFRHKYIPLNGFIFTNLSPEHIESHGSFEKYREAKLSIADNLSSRKNSVLVVNGDDENSEYFLQKKAGAKISFSLKDAEPYSLENGIVMNFDGMEIKSKLKGEFNIYNILGVCTLLDELGIENEKIKEGIESVGEVLGRAQEIKEGQDFTVVVDYAHTPDSLNAIYKAYPENKICILGNTGGGRDTWKRPEMAKIADKYCSHIILTNEDPYDEDPNEIVAEMKEAIKETPCDVIMDRREAISNAFKMAKNGDAVLITGKGTDPYIMEADGKKTPWSDAEVCREELKKLDFRKIL